MTRVLVLRPEPGATATVERARERGLDAVAVPLFEVRPVAWAAPEAGSFDALLLTSASAVRCAGEQLSMLRGLPAYAVGPATAEAARQAGFDIAATGDAGVERLLGSVDPQSKLLHLTGVHRTIVGHARQSITPIAVYAATEKNDVALDELRNAVALVHSARAGQRLAELVGKDCATLAIAAISHEAAKAAGSGWAAVEAADEPNDDALLVLTERLCNKVRFK